MGQAKHQLDEKESKKVDRRVKRAASRNRATFIDMKPDKATKEAVIAVTERYDDCLEYIAKAFVSPEIALSLKYDGESKCWKGQISNVNEKWPNITYYMFRHRDMYRLLAHIVYVINEQWDGGLPLGEVDTKDLDW